MFKIQREEGSVFVLVLATLTVMLIIGVGFTAWFMSSGRGVAFRRTEKKEYRAAETGVERAMLRLRNDPAFRDLFLDANPNTVETFTLTIEGRIVNVTVRE